MSRNKLKFLDQLKLKGQDQFYEILIHGIQNPKGQMLEMPCKTVKYMTDKIIHHINKLKYTASIYGCISLSSNQVGENQKIFVISQNLYGRNWINDNLTQAAYQTYINPIITAKSVLEEYYWEQCPSLPTQRFVIKRAESVKVQYLNEKMEQKQEELNGFLSRIFQHEYDHLLGSLVSNFNNNQGQFEILEEYKDYDQIQELQNSNYCIMKEDDQKPMQIQKMEPNMQKSQIEKQMKQLIQLEKQLSKQNSKQQQIPEGYQGQRGRNLKVNSLLNNNKLKKKVDSSKKGNNGSSKKQQ